MVKNRFVTGRTNERVDGLIVDLVSFKHIFDSFLTLISKLCNGTDWHVEFILPGNYTLSQLEGNRRSHGWWTMKFNGMTPGHR